MCPGFVLKILGLARFGAQGSRFGEVSCSVFWVWPGFVFRVLTTNQYHDKPKGKRLVHPRAAGVSRYLDLRRSSFMPRVLGFARFRALTTN